MWHGYLYDKEINMNEEIERMKQFPSCVQIESTNICNSRCVMCPVWTDKMTRKREHMTWEVFKKAVDDCFGKRIDEVHLHQNGEPLLIGIPTLCDRIEYAKRNLNPQGTKVGFYTNGALMSDLATEAILREQPDFIIFSFDGGIKEDYEKVRVGLCFEEVVANIKYFAKRRIELNLVDKIRMGTMFIPQKDNENHVAEYLTLFKGLQFDVGTGGLNNYAGDIDDEKIMHRFQHKIREEERPCWRLWTTMVVQSNGLCSLCCSDFNGTQIIGDVRNNTIEEIWQGEKLEAIRKMHIEHKQNLIPICKNCDVMDYIGVPSWWYK